MLTNIKIDKEDLENENIKMVEQMKIKKLLDLFKKTSLESHNFKFEQILLDKDIKYLSNQEIFESIIWLIDHYCYDMNQKIKAVAMINEIKSRIEKLWNCGGPHPC